MDFFSEPALRELILRREGSRCFYCLKSLGPSTFVIEHVLSRPTGANGYRNLVAACISCNNRKGALSAGDFVRMLYRDGFLSEKELAQRLSQLDRLAAGELKPDVTGLFLQAESVVAGEGAASQEAAQPRDAADAQTTRAADP